MKKFVLYAFLTVSFLGFSQNTSITKINEYLSQTKKQYNLTDQDIQDWEVMSIGDSDNGKTEYYYIVQRYNGIQIFNSFSNAIIKEGKVVNIHNSFIANIASKVNGTTPSLSAIEAVNKAKLNLGEAAIATSVIETISNTSFKLRNGNLESDPITATLVYHPTNDAKLQLAWDITYYTQDYKHLWSLRVDATSGKILDKADLVISCTFNSPDHKNHNHSAKEFNFTAKGFKDENATAAFQIQGGSYRVIPYNYSSPDHSPFQLVVNPENATASPKGWHDTNSSTTNTAANKYTITRGNNVLASSDYTNTNPTTTSTTPTADGYAPNGGAALNFDFPYGGTGVAAQTYIDAAATNLFYMNNIMHDVWYNYGFNELNGNFQKTHPTFTSGGSANDFVYAQAQDGSLATTPSVNNANFGTPIDGSSPRMQMFLWNQGPVPKYLTVNSPTSIAGSYRAVNNSFNPGNVALPPSPGITSNLVLYNDNNGNFGCVASVDPSVLSGKIVLIKRTGCDFAVKVKNAQNAGAIAVIIMNNISNEYVNMSGADGTINIPALFITLELGNELLAQLANGSVNVKIENEVTGFVNTDGDFDNGIIAHEYGHGISTRLAGGRNNSSCLNNYDAMGEGWSDWFALMLQLKPGDLKTDRKTIATFVYNQPVTGGGIRPYPYTTDMTLNPQTYNYTNTPIPADPDNTSYRYKMGDFWATVLWDLNWAYIEKYGYDNNIYTGTGGNNKVMKLVLDGIKGQPCSPGIVQGRDALLAAAAAGDKCMIWQVFARRGVGVNASSGNTNTPDDQVEDFSVPAECALGTSGFNYERNLKVYPNPASSNVTVELNDYNGGAIKVVLFDINGRNILSTTIDASSSIKQIDISSLQNGVYFLKLDSDTISTTKKIIKN